MASRAFGREADCGGPGLWIGPGPPRPASQPEQGNRKVVQVRALSANFRLQLIELRTGNGRPISTSCREAHPRTHTMSACSLPRPTTAISPSCHDALSLHNPASVLCTNPFGPTALPRACRILSEFGRNRPNIYRNLVEFGRNRSYSTEAGPDLVPDLFNSCQVWAILKHWPTSVRNAAGIGRTLVESCPHLSKFGRTLGESGNIWSEFGLNRYPEIGSQKLVELGQRLAKLGQTKLGLKLTLPNMGPNWSKPADWTGSGRFRPKFGRIRVSEIRPNLGRILTDFSVLGTSEPPIRWVGTVWSPLPKDVPPPRPKDGTPNRRLGPWRRCPGYPRNAHHVGLQRCSSKSAPRVPLRPSGRQFRRTSVQPTYCAARNHSLPSIASGGGWGQGGKASRRAESIQGATQPHPPLRPIMDQIRMWAEVFQTWANFGQYPPEIYSSRADVDQQRDDVDRIWACFGQVWVKFHRD